MAGTSLTTVNVSGTRFEITTRTFNRLLGQSDSKCLTEAIVTGTSQKEYFFERNADSFAVILDFLRHGELHLPPTVCPKLFQRELSFWGVDIARMENCCYNTFVSFVDDRKTLEKFEKQTNLTCLKPAKPPHTRLGRFRAAVWAVLDEPTSSVYAKIFMGLVVLFGLGSVFVIVAGTHPLFQRNLRKNEWKEYLGEDFASHLPLLRQFYEDWYYDEDFYNDAFTNDPDVSTTEHDDPDDSTTEPDDYDDNSTETDDPDDNATKPGIGKFMLPVTTPSPDSLSKEKLQAAYARLDILRYIEYAALIFFTMEFVMRIIFCPSFKLYFFSVINILDFVALAALYVSVGLELFVPEKRYTATSYDLIQCVQFMRIFRFLRLVKNVTGFRVLIYSFISSAKELLLLLSFLALGVLIYGSVVFYAEETHNMKSIPDAIWWALITMTTVGYGDIVPKTFLGKLIAAMCAISGVLLLAVTVPIFVNTFILFYNYSKVMDARALEAMRNQRTPSQKISSEKSLNKVKPLSEAVEMKGADD